MLLVLCFWIRFRDTRNWIWFFGQTKFEFFAWAEVSFILSIPDVDSIDCGLVLSGWWLLAITGIDILAEMLLCDVMFRDFNSGGFFIDDENARPRRKVALFMKQKRGREREWRKPKWYREKVKKCVRQKLKLKMYNFSHNQIKVPNQTNMHQNRTNEQKNS